MIEAVIFDLDGVLIGIDLSVKILGEVLGENGIRSSQNYIRRSFGLDTEKIIRSLAKDLCDDRVTEIAGEYRKKKNEAHHTLCPGVIDLLDRLKKNEYKLAVASSAPLYSIKKILRNVGIYSYFDVLQGYDDLRHKPEPDIYTSCTQKLRIKPEECVVIEDSIEGVEAARRASIVYVVAILTGANTRKEFSEIRYYKPDCIISDLTKFDLIY